MLTSVNKRGGNAQLEICYGADHNVWDRAYSDEKLIAWMLDKKNIRTGIDYDYKE